MLKYEDSEYQINKWEAITEKNSSSFNRKNYFGNISIKINKTMKINKEVHFS